MLSYCLLLPLIVPGSSECLWSNQGAYELTVYKSVVGDPGSIDCKQSVIVNNQLKTVDCLCLFTELRPTENPQCQSLITIDRRI
jgi:hypothetical protein